MDAIKASLDRLTAEKLKLTQLLEKSERHGVRATAGPDTECTKQCVISHTISSAVCHAYLSTLMAAIQCNSKIFGFFLQEMETLLQIEKMCPQISDEVSVEIPEENMEAELPDTQKL